MNSEFPECDNVAIRHQAKLYFARPGSPQERDTNENINGLFASIFPKASVGLVLRRLIWQAELVVLPVSLCIHFENWCFGAM